MVFKDFSRFFRQFHVFQELFVDFRDIFKIFFWYIWCFLRIFRILVNFMFFRNFLMILRVFSNYIINLTFLKNLVPMAEWSALQTSMRGNLGSIPAKVKTFFEGIFEFLNISYCHFELDFNFKFDWNFFAVKKVMNCPPTACVTEHVTLLNVS